MAAPSVPTLGRMTDLSPATGLRRSEGMSAPLPARAAAARPGHIGRARARPDLLREDASRHPHSPLLPLSCRHQNCIRRCAETSFYRPSLSHRLFQASCANILADTRAPGTTTSLRQASRATRSRTNARGLWPTCRSSARHLSTRQKARSSSRFRAHSTTAWCGWSRGSRSSSTRLASGSSAPCSSGGPLQPSSQER